MNEHFYCVIYKEIVAESLVLKEIWLLYLVLYYFVLKVSPGVSTPVNVLKVTSRSIEIKQNDLMLNLTQEKQVIAF